MVARPRAVSTFATDKARRVIGRHRIGRVDGGEELLAVQLIPDGSEAFNPAFDVTPARLVSALITEKGVASASEAGLRGLYGALD